jgi:UDP-N-acetylglucosamine 2-epimerase
MDKVFFDELGIPEPTVNLNVGSSNPNSQIAQIILGTAEALEQFKPDVVVVWGDTNSSLGVSVATVKANVPLVHVEAGCRSYDMRMAEEMHRRLIDHAADILFPVSARCQKILEEEKVPGKIFQFGDPLYDMFLKNFAIAGKRSEITKKLDLKAKPLAILTVHRAENVDNPLTFKTIIEALGGVRNLKVVFPVHPRTESRLKEFGLLKELENSSLKTIPPVGYWDFLLLLQNTSLVITDSGGVQKEAFFAKVPCITLRRTTEWVETVESGANTLLDPESEGLSDLLIRAVEQSPKVKEKLKTLENPYGDGRAAERIVNLLSQIDL